MEEGLSSRISPIPGQPLVCADYVLLQKLQGLHCGKKKKKMHIPLNIMCWPVKIARHRFDGLVDLIQHRSSYIFYFKSQFYHSIHSGFAAASASSNAFTKV
ncbi:unnamed protein product [Caretta caretta]